MHQVLQLIVVGVLSIAVLGCSTGTTTERHETAMDTARDATSHATKSYVSNESWSWASDEIDIKQIAYYETEMIRDWGRTEIEGFGWFTPWTWPSPPTIQIGYGAKREEVDAVHRAVAVINRALPADMEIRIDETRVQLPQVKGGTADIAQVTPGTIVVGFVDQDAIGGWGGIGTGDGRRGVALLSDASWVPELRVHGIAHELIHAMGFGAHPQGVARSWMSYTRLELGLMRENLPLIDTAMLLFKLDQRPGRGQWDTPEGWGRWSGSMETFWGTVDGIQFGVHQFNDYHVPWVDAGMMEPPHESSKMHGSAMWNGEFAGVARDDTMVHGRTGIAFDLNAGEGDIRFDELRTWPYQQRWGPGFKYGLQLRGYWFESTDKDGKPDVVGTIYGRDGEIAAGTLERDGLTGAFGAERP